MNHVMHETNGCTSNCIACAEEATYTGPKCTCNGMEFICNRWVFTGRCICKTLPDWDK